LLIIYIAYTEPVLKVATQNTIA